MPGSLPAARPVFLDEELRNGAFATPTLLRKMIDWCRFTYARDLPYSPCDPAYGATVVVGDTFYRSFGSFYVPDPLGPSRRLVIHLRGWGSSGKPSPSFPLEILLTSNRGQSTTCLVTTSDAWQEFSWSCAPDSVVTVQARIPPDLGIYSIYFGGICAYWEEPSALVPGASFDTTGTPLPAQSFPVQNRALSVALTRSLARWMNRFTARTTRMVVAKFYPGFTEGIESRLLSASGPGYVLKRYKVWISDQADSITCQWLVTTTGTTVTITCEIVGGSSTTAAVEDGICTVAVTPGAGRVEELVVTLGYTVPGGEYHLQGFHAWENGIDTAAIPAPSGETLYGSMPTLARDSIRAESAILASGQTGWLSVLQALQYLVATRSRALVKDCGLPLSRTTGEAFSGDPNVGIQQTIPLRDRPSPLGVGETVTARLRSAARGRSTDSSLPAGVFIQRWQNVLGTSSLVETTAAMVSAPKAAVDEEYGTFQAPAGTKVQDWPEWIVNDQRRSGTILGAGYMDALMLGVSPAGGLYEAQWAGCSVELFIPEADVP